MRRLTPLLLGLLAVAGCHATSHGPTSPTSVALEREVFLVASFGAPGDSIRVGVVWSRSKRGDGYKVTVTATPAAGWTGLPVGVAVPGNATLSYQFTAVNTAGWDSVALTPCVAGTMTGKADAAPTCGPAYMVRRGPTSPDTVRVDPSLIIARFRILPNGEGGTSATTVDVGVKLCMMSQSADSMWRLIDGLNGAYCRKLYDDSLPARQKPGGYPVQYEVASRTYDWGGYRFTTRTPRAELARLTFAGPFRAREG